SFLEGNGVPSVVERTMIRPPSARLGPLSVDERRAVITQSPFIGKYDTAVDSESAYEKLRKRDEDKVAQEAQDEHEGGGLFGSIFGTTRKRGERLTTLQLIAREITRRLTGRFATQVGKWLAGSMGGSIGSAIARGTLGGILRQQSSPKKEKARRKS